MKNDEWRMMKDEWWWFQAVEGFCFKMDEQTNGHTFLIVESLSRLKIMPRALEKFRIMQIHSINSSRKFWDPKKQGEWNFMELWSRNKQGPLNFQVWGVNSMSLTPKMLHLVFTDLKYAQWDWDWLLRGVLNDWGRGGVYCLPPPPPLVLPSGWEVWDLRLVAGPPPPALASQRP